MNTENKIIELMGEAERKAWRALEGYKFWMFGYHASAWVKYNQLLEEPFGNPFRGLVGYAREAEKPLKGRR